MATKAGRVYSSIYKSARAKHQNRISLTLSRADLSGTRNEALSSVHNQWFEVVTRSNTDITASSTTNTLIDPSSDPFYSVFQRSTFYRCKHRIHQRVHIYFRVMWILSKWKEASNFHRERWGRLTLKLCFINFVQSSFNFHSFTWHWLDPYFVIKKLLFDREKPFIRILESTIAFLRFRYKAFLKFCLSWFQTISHSINLFFELVVACFCLACVASVCFLPFRRSRRTRAETLATQASFCLSCLHHHAYVTAEAL